MKNSHDIEESGLEADDTSFMEGLGHFEAVEAQDRKLSKGVISLIAAFSISSSACMYAVCLISVYFLSIVASEGKTEMIPALVGLVVIFIVGIVGIDLAQLRSLPGIRALRTQFSTISKAAFAVLILLIFYVVHPLMGATVTFSIILGISSHYFISRVSRNEPRWDFLPREAISFLAGRGGPDYSDMTKSERNHALASSISSATSALSFIASVASGSYLIATDVLSESAIAAVAIGAVFMSNSIMKLAEGLSVNERELDAQVMSSNKVESSIEPVEQLGLWVQDLTVFTSNETRLLEDINFHLEPGTVTGVLGESGSGKSLLLRSLIDPFSQQGLKFCGSVEQNGTSLWKRSEAEQVLPAVYLPDSPIALPGSGADNLSCFHINDLLERGRNILEQLIFAADTVEDICSCESAKNLPMTQLRVLALARAFLLSPQLYLMDRPEIGLPEKQVTALIRRISLEKRLGKSILMVTENRAILDTCDKLIVLQKGRIIDYGPSKEILNRVETGWIRFLGARKLEVEDNLNTWIRSHFYRNGDEVNRRQVASVASDMLTFSCLLADSFDPGHVEFEFKHFKGYCVLRMSDSGEPISEAKMQVATREAENVEVSKPSLLAKIIRRSIAIEVEEHEGARVLEVKIETYDPRIVKGPRILDQTA